MRAYFANLGLAQFLRDYDHLLLVNQPKMWVIRLPYLLIYTILANVLVFVFILALPLQLYHIQEFFTILWMVFIACLAALFFWIWKFWQYSPEKAYENTFPMTGLVDYLIYVVCIVVILFPAITTSLTLFYRFDSMITSQELAIDSSRLRSYSNWWFPDDLMLKYAGLTEDDLMTLDHYQITSAVWQSIDRLNDIKNRDFEELQGITSFYFLATHIGLLMFSGKHLSGRVFKWSFLYGLIVFILFSIIAAVLSILKDSATILGRLIDGINPEITEGPGLFVAFIVFMTIMAFSVLRRDERSDFAAMNMFLLPVGISIYLAYLITNQARENDWFLFMYGRPPFWFEMLVKSPLLYLWTIPYLKILYLRHLALPEK